MLVWFCSICLFWVVICVSMWFVVGLMVFRNGFELLYLELCCLFWCFEFGCLDFRLCGLWFWFCFWLLIFCWWLEYCCLGFEVVCLVLVTRMFGCCCLLRGLVFLGFVLAWLVLIDLCCVFDLPYNCSAWSLVFWCFELGFWWFWWF